MVSSCMWTFLAWGFVFSLLETFCCFVFAVSGLLSPLVGWFLSARGLFSLRGLFFAFGNFLLLRLCRVRFAFVFGALKKVFFSGTYSVICFGVGFLLGPFFSSLHRNVFFLRVGFFCFRENPLLFFAVSVLLSSLVF